METLGIVLLRAVVGLTLAAHGGQKLFGWWGGPGFEKWVGAVTSMGAKPPMLWALAAVAAELAGGLALALGFLTPIVAFAIAGNLLFAILAAHLSKGFFTSKGGFEFPLVLAAGAISVGLIGAGTISVDSWLGISFVEPITIILSAVTFLGGSALAYGTKAITAHRTSSASI